MRASAHLAAAEGAMPFLDDGQLFAAGTTWGIVTEEDDAYLQGCEEAIAEPPRFFARVHDAEGTRFFVATSAGVIVTTDGGCSYTDAAGTEARNISVLVAAHSGGSSASSPTFALTADD